MCVTVKRLLNPLFPLGKRAYLLSAVPHSILSNSERVKIEFDRIRPTQTRKVAKFTHTAAFTSPVVTIGGNDETLSMELIAEYACDLRDKYCLLSHEPGQRFQK